MRSGTALGVSKTRKNGSPAPAQATGERPLPGVDRVTVAELLNKDSEGGPANRPHNSDPIHLSRLLRSACERRKHETDSETDREPGPRMGTFYEALCCQAPVSSDTPLTAAE